MNILWLTWKDIKNPNSGGAEEVNEELAAKLVKDGHQVKFIVAGFKGGKAEENINGYYIIRVGNRFTVYWQAFRYFQKNLQNWPNLIIEEINTVPFFVQFYKPEKTQLILFFHQLCREIWFFQSFFPLNLIGYLSEPIYLKSLAKNNAITVSKSTKNDLLKYGFKSNQVKIISEGIKLAPIVDLTKSNKFNDFTLLSCGSIRPMKRTDQQIKAFEIAKKYIPSLKLIIAGDAESNYAKKVMKIIELSPFRKDVKYLGKIDSKAKEELMRRCHILLVTSLKEGWGLVVTEANSQGTPAIVYNADGLRDSVKNYITGIICSKNSPENLANNIFLLYKNKDLYQKLRFNAWRWSKEISFARSYEQFKKILLRC